MIYLELFWVFFQIGLFSIGGGYAVLPMIQTHVVEVRSWLTIAEFTDIVTISQMTPGPIGINAATFVGTKIAGPLGAVTATVGCVAPSFVIVLSLAYIYTKYKNIKVIQGILSGLRPAVVGLIAASGLSIAILSFWGGNHTLNLRNIDLFAVALFALSLFILRKWKLNPIYVMAGAALLGLAAYYLPLPYFLS